MKKIEQDCQDVRSKKELISTDELQPAWLGFLLRCGRCHQRSDSVGDVGEKRTCNRVFPLEGDTFILQIAFTSIPETTSTRETVDDRLL